MPPSPAEVAAFVNPDDVAARLEERLEGNYNESVEQLAESSPSELDDAAFETALNEAVTNENQVPEAEHSESEGNADIFVETVGDATDAIVLEAESSEVRQSDEA